MKKLFLFLVILPNLCMAQFVKQGICTSSGDEFTLNGVAQSPYAGRFFCTTAANLNSDFDLRFSAYLGNMFNNGMAFLFIPGSSAPTTTNPPLVISTDNIHNFGTGSVNTDFVVEFDIRGSFCASGQNTSYEPTTDVNHIAYWKNNSSCNFANYYSTYSSLGTINYYAFEPYRIKWTKSTNTLETYYNNVLIKSNIIDLVGLLGSTAYWGFSAGCYCVSGGPVVKDMYLNNRRLLPVSLKNFSAEAHHNSVTLSWTTSVESNSDHFELEKSTDGTSFQLLQQIPAAGNSSSEIKYSGFDGKPVYGTNFYRLKMVDKDGRHSYSRVVAVKINQATDELIIFPNPVTNVLRLQVPPLKNQEAIIEVGDATGKTVVTQTIRSGNYLRSTSIDISPLAKGVYMVILSDGNEKKQQRFVKQ